jgi:hypothetical protein
MPRLAPPPKSENGDLDWLAVIKIEPVARALPLCHWCQEIGRCDDFDARGSANWQQMAPIAGDDVCRRGDNGALQYLVVVRVGGHNFQVARYRYHLQNREQINDRFTRPPVENCQARCGSYGASCVTNGNKRNVER